MNQLKRALQELDPVEEALVAVYEYAIRVLEDVVGDIPQDRLVANLMTNYAYDYYAARGRKEEIHMALLDLVAQAQAGIPGMIEATGPDRPPF